MISAVEALTRSVANASLFVAARRRLEAALLELFAPAAGPLRVDFLEPKGDPGIFGPESVAWRVHGNPVTMFVGGIAAVFLELAEPRVRTGVWEHTDFRRDPVGRMRRTGLAAMVTTYGATRDVEAVTARVRRMHDRVAGTTPEGAPYRANDPELLAWVHATASFGFLRAHLRFVDPATTHADRDRYFAEGARGAAFYGVLDPPTSVAATRALFERTRPTLVNHPILEEFRALVSRVPAVTTLALPVQRLLVEAAIDILPAWARRRLDLEQGQRRRVLVRPLVRSMATLAAPLARVGIPDLARRRVGGLT